MEENGKLTGNNTENRKVINIFSLLYRLCYCIYNVEDFFVSSKAPLLSWISAMILQCIFGSTFLLVIDPAVTG